MLLEKMNWMDVDEYLKKDDRIVLVTGSVEEHGYLSLVTDTLIPFHIAKEACEKERVILAPPLYFGPTHFGLGFPGTISIEFENYIKFIEDILRSFIRHGFRRILILNGHGPNEGAINQIPKLTVDHSGIQIIYKTYYELPKVYSFIENKGSTDAHHASWIENFSWINRVKSSDKIPKGKKKEVNITHAYTISAEDLRKKLGNGVAGGKYEEDEEYMREFFRTAVDEVRRILQFKDLV